MSPSVAAMDDNALDTTIETSAPAPLMEWLLDSDPAIRWQVMRDLTDTPADVVATERGRVAHVGWGARLLAARDADGQWMGGACFPGRGAPPDDDSQPWTATLPVMLDLHDLGLDPTSETAREMTSLVAANCRWEYNGEPFFDGEVEPCINGHTVTLGAYFGADVDGHRRSPARRSARRRRLELRGRAWRHRVVVRLDDLRARGTARVRGRAGRLGRDPRCPPPRGAVPARALACSGAGAPARCRSTTWLEFSFPTRWHYDVLRGLDYFRRADLRDPRLGEAIELVRSKRQDDGTWLLENTHRGAVHVEFEEGDGRPSRWNTLRARRVLGWWDGHGQ